jgi:hypothetical protein
VVLLAGGQGRCGAILNCDEVEEVGVQGVGGEACRIKGRVLLNVFVAGEEVGSAGEAEALCVEGEEFPEQEP